MWLYFIRHRDILSKWSTNINKQKIEFISNIISISWSDAIILTFCTHGNMLLFVYGCLNDLPWFFNVTSMPIQLILIIFISALHNKWFNLLRYALYISQFLSWYIPLNLLINDLLFVSIDSFKPRLIIKISFIEFPYGKASVIFLGYHLMERWRCYLGITHTQYLPPINSWHCIPELNYISLVHVTPKRRFRIT